MCKLDFACLRVSPLFWGGGFSLFTSAYFVVRLLYIYTHAKYLHCFMTLMGVSICVCHERALSCRDPKVCVAKCAVVTGLRRHLWRRHSAEPLRFTLDLSCARPEHRQRAFSNAN